ncbi:MAG: DUF4345 domain-containing protein [Bacteroidota bacterium]
MKKVFQISLGLIGLIPFTLGLIQLIYGARMFIDPTYINVQLDSQIRFGAIWFMVAAFIGWWMIPRVDQAQYTPLFRIMFLTMAVAGVARLASILLIGNAEPSLFVAPGIEISLVLLIPWQSAVVKHARNQK